MLVNLSEILKIAEEKGIAIGAFNTPNLTSLKAIIAAAEEINKPVIIMHAQVHEEMDLCTIEEVAPMMVAAAKRASVPVCVHLDHGTDLDYVKRGLDLGFTSVMYDGSTLSTEENIKNTITAVQMAHEKGASVEAEIGSMGTREGGNGNDTSIYTDPDTAKDFVVKTGVDALACAFGTAHGFYKDTPKLDFDRLSKINSLIDVPIVMHGGSGVSEDGFKQAIANGIRKINYYSYMSKAGYNAAKARIEKGDTSYLHDIEYDAMLAMKEDVKKAIKVFSNN
jgi:fructose-bisphosphate aldolase class II